MAEEQEQVAQETKELKPKNPLVMIIAIVIIATLLAGGVSFLVVKNMMGEAGKPETKIIIADRVGPLFPLTDEFLINLADTDSNHYIKAKMTLELSSEEMKAEVTERTAQIRDDIISILRTKKAEDLQKTEGIANLKEEIRKKCNEKLTTGTIMTIYFTDLVMQ